MGGVFIFAFTQKFPRPAIPQAECRFINLTLTINWANLAG
jgi:hypothetical protein